MIQSVYMARRKRFDLLTIICIAIGIIGAVLCSLNTPPSSNSVPHPTNKLSHMKEGDYVNMYCKGIIEYQLPDRTRVDCLTDEYAIEYDWAKKWAESIGQAMYYSKMTGKKPAVAIIIKNPYERIYIKRIEKANPDIKIFEIKAENYTD